MKFKMTEEYVEKLLKILKLLEFNIINSQISADIHSEAYKEF